MPQSVHLALVPPSNEKFTVRMPRRKPNAEYRSREHLTEREVERLIEAVKGNRWGHRDATMVPLAYRHGLRAATQARPIDRPGYSPLKFLRRVRYGNAA